VHAVTSKVLARQLDKINIIIIIIIIIIIKKKGKAISATGRGGP
jgi:hypothetical protein